MIFINTLLLVFITLFAQANAKELDNTLIVDKTNVILPISEGMFVQSNGAQIYCRTFGKGDPVVVIHGGPGLSHEYLLPQMTKLGDKNRVIFYDQRACGRSTGAVTTESINIAMFMEDIEAIRKTLGYEKITVLGHSWGGFLTMEYGIRHPDSVTKIILMNSAPASSEGFALFMKEWVKRVTPFQTELTEIKESKEFRGGLPAATEKYHRIIFRTYCYNPQKADLLNLFMTPEAFMNGSQVAEIFRQTLFSKPYDLRPQLKKMDIPTLVIHGDFDVVPPITAQEIHDSIPGSKFILLKNCGHFPYVEIPDELFMELRGFLK